jgi:son of sevenless-like protein
MGESMIWSKRAYMSMADSSLQLAGAAPQQVGNLAAGPIPPSIVPRAFRKLRLTDIDPLELARQLTIMDASLFGKITAQECLGKAWPKEYGSNAPNISAMIDMSNAVSGVVPSRSPRLMLEAP